MTDALDRGERTATLADVARDALCAQIDLDLFFPAPSSSARLARAVCALCPVQAECVEVACALGVDGIWGGTNVKQRLRLGGRGPTLVPDEVAGVRAAGRAVPENADGSSEVSDV